ncbi:MAG: hypothetical protein IPK19_08475 [Chloroflexi bacterium]|nr:hypothetical protein [Chloroflexota bacterium]
MIRQMCPVTGFTEDRTGFSASGVILTAFDWRATWHFDVETGRRYPIPETAPCGRNCRLSPDGTILIYFNDATNAHNVMALDGSNRAFLTTNAIDVQWWDEDTLFAWTPGVNAFLLRDGEEEPFEADNLISVQPGGRWGLRTTFDGQVFQRTLVDLTSDAAAEVPLAEDFPYFNNYAWSPDHQSLAYVQPIPISEGVYASELFMVDLETLERRQLTQLAITYGITRINGVAVNDLAWSPDSTRLAFWVLPLDADGAPAEEAAEVVPGVVPSDPGATGAVLHILDLADESLTVYCGYSSATHTPNPPHLVWSPDGDAIAFAADLVDDGHGAFLVALSIETGVYHILSEGLYAAYGIPDVYLWGRKR